MKAARRKDHTIRPNTQDERSQTDLWDVWCAGELIATQVGEAAAQEMADRLNLDPFAMDRGQTRLDLGGARNYPRDENLRFP